MSDLTSNQLIQISSLTGAIESLKVVEAYIQKLKKEIEAELKKAGGDSK